MKKLGKNTLLYIISICIFVVALVMAIVDFAVPLNLWIHPLLNFLFFIALGFGIMCFALGFIKKSPWYFFLSAMLLAISLVYVLIGFKVVWYIVVISVVALLLVIMSLSFITAGNKTEDIALNKSEDYKNYEQRKAEKEQAVAVQEQEELPQIKSFKE